MTGSARSRLRCLLLLFVLGAGFVPGGVADPGSGEVRRVKAAFVLNIARFVTWPGDAFGGSGDPVRLCFYKDNPLGSAVETIRGKRVGKRSLAISTVDDPRAARACQILFVPAAELGRFPHELGSGGAPILTMTDGTDGAASRRGIMLTLVRNKTRIGFEIDLALVRGAGLKMSAQLLKLARIVGDSSSGGTR